MWKHHQVQRRTEALHQRHCAGRATSAREAGLAEQMARDRAIHNAQHESERLRIGSEKESQRVRQRQDPLPQWTLWQHLIGQQRGGLGHAPRPARRTEPALLAAERHQLLRRDIGWLAAGLCVLLGFALLQRSGAPGMTALSQGALYVAVVLFYALEMLVGHSARTRAWLWRGGAAFLAVLAVRGLVVKLGRDSTDRCHIRQRLRHRMGRPVPLPAAAWLLLSGLAGFGFVGATANGGLKPD